MTAVVAPGAPRYTEGSVVAQKYRLIRLLGEGGMGTVWLAQNVALGVQVALKLIRSEIAGKVGGLSERLLQEARAAASIGHPAIIQVFDFGLTEQSDPYIAMELLQGESLANVLKRRGKLAASRAVRTLLPVVEALVVANQRGIVHRDLKPDNIFLSHQAQRIQPKLLDFGIAKLSQNFSANLTSEGTVLGSPAYMSPEQARGQADVDFRSDVWALCVVLYEMVTGTQAFSGPHWHGLMWSIMEGKPLSLAEHGIDEPQLWQVLERGLAKDRSGRYPSMFEFGKALAGWLVAQGVTRDVCNTSLRSTWLERAEDAGPNSINSFFPSDAPGSDGEAALPKLVLEPPGSPAAEARPIPAHEVIRAAKSRIRRSYRTRPGSLKPRERGSTRLWIWVGVVGAVVSFSAAVAHSLSRRAALEEYEAPAVQPHLPSKDLGIRTRRDLLPEPKLHLNDELDSLEEARTLGRANAAPAKKAGSAPSSKKVVKKPRGELKDPFSN